MIVTTTPSIEGKTIREYKGIVGGEVISGVDRFSNLFGGGSQSYEGVLMQARDSAFRKMEQRAYGMGANAIVGVDINFQVGTNNLMVTVSGTAVVVE